MQDFKSELIKEFDIKDYAAIEFRFNHSLKNSFDKKANINITKNNILVNVKFYDKTAKLIFSGNIKFINDKLANVSEKKLKNISPEELNKKFINAKNDIINSIAEDINTKINDLNERLNILNNYSNNKEQFDMNEKYDM